MTRRIVAPLVLPAAAARAPISVWPWAPMLNRPALKQIPTERPARISGVALTRVSIQPFGDRSEPEIRAPANPVALPLPAEGRLRFDTVTFHYPTRKDTSALDGFSLDVRPNERLAVVGPSGAGKTTIFQLAQRFYDPESGRVLLDGVDLRDADPADVRQRIAMVPQDVVIFAASARDNLRYGNWDASEDDIWEAARDANAESCGSCPAAAWCRAPARGRGTGD